MPDRRDASPCVSVNSRSISAASFLFAIVVGIFDYIMAEIDGPNLAGHTVILSGLSIFACGFLLAFVGLFCHAVTLGGLSRNLGAAGFLFVASAIPTTLLLFFAHDLQSYWPALRLYGLIFAVDIVCRRRQSTA